MTLLITGDEQTIDRTYDKIFDICDKYTTFFKIETDEEYPLISGYVVKFDCPPDAEFEISELEHVSVL